jgi:hypothetical protein
MRNIEEEHRGGTLWNIEEDREGKLRNFEEEL